MRWPIVGALLAAVALTARAHEPPPPSRAPAPATSAPSADDAKLEDEIRRELGSSPAPPGSAPAPASATASPATGAATPGAAPTSSASGSSPGTGGNPLARVMMLPDVSAIGSFAGAYDTLDVAQLSPRSGSYGAPHEITPIFQELELGLQSVIDPYARADIFISFTPGGVDVEEAYLTTLSLPAGFQLRAGKFFSPFGRLNQQHPHVWDFADAPLAMDRLVSVDTLKGPGVDVSWLAPVSWFAELHLAGQTTRPGFESVDRRTLVARLQQFFDLASGATVGFGLSGATVESPAAGASDLLGGADLFVKIRPVDSRSYFVFQGELFGRKVDGTADAFARAGGYLHAVYRMGPYWAFGARGEVAPAVIPGTTTVTNDSGTEYRVSALGSWLPSEFQRLRAQLSWDRLPGGRDAFEALLTLEFIIGAHGAHPF